MKRATLAVATALFAAACQDASGPGPELRSPSAPSLASAPVGAEVIPNQYIVVLNPSVADVSIVARELVTRHGGSLRHTYRTALKGFSANISAAGAAAIAGDPRVAYVEQNQVMRIIETQTGATWGLDRIDQRDLPLSTTYTYNATGAGVDAYIIDTGILTTHVDFGGRAIHGRDEVDNDADATDCNGHGTHVAGTVGGTTWGVAKNVRLIAVRVLNCSGNGTNEDVIAGIDWVTAHHEAGKPAVANMSLGGGFSQATNDAVTNSVNDGVVYSLAAGNGYANACDGSPASTPAGITVGATGSNDAEASFSDRGPCLDIWAPGVGITSAWIGSNTATETISGTSMAAPHVAGAAALYLESAPAATADQVDEALSLNATVGKITWTNPFGAKPAPPPPGQDYLLYVGFINGGPPPPPPPAPADPSDLAAAAVSKSQINLTWSDNSDNETGFKIERCTGATCTNFSQVATAPANATSYSDPGLNPSTTYRYQVRANNGSTNSGYTNVAAATTGANANPTARYTWSCGNSKGGRVCSFNGTTSSDNDVGSITNYSWNFGDGTTGSGSQVTRTFPSRGTFNVTLTVTDNNGGPDSAGCPVATGTSGNCQ